MHSRIIQISSNPINKNEYIEESCYYDHWFTNSIADYVYSVDESSREEQLKKWISDIQGLKYNSDTETLTVADKEQYFHNQYDEFMEVTHRLNSIDISAFIDESISIEVCRLKAAYDNKFGLYIDDNGESFGLITLDDWVRRNPTGTTVHLGGIVGFHW